MSYVCRRLRPGRAAAAIRTLATLVVAFAAIFAIPAWGLSEDGVLLLQFKFSVLSDPLGVLGDWNYDDATPCAWNGVMCVGFPDGAAFNWMTDIGANGRGAQTWNTSRVIGLVLPDCQLFGSVPSALGLVEHLRHLDLSGNMLNGTIPELLFSARELRVLSLADNEISGELPEVDWRMKDLQVLNLSDNALSGPLPAGLAQLPNLTSLSLANNYLYGELPDGGFERLEFLDLSLNLFNGSLPGDLGGQGLRYLNLSSNSLLGEIPAELGARMPANATLDFSYNNLTGEIPQAGLFDSQRPSAFAGNADLCGKPLNNLCSLPSTFSAADPPDITTTTPLVPKSTPAFAAMPRNAGRAPPAEVGESSTAQSGLRPVVIIAIIVGDLVGIAILFTVFLYVYQVKKTKKDQQQQELKKDMGSVGLNRTLQPPPPSVSLESKGNGGLCCCLRSKDSGDNVTEDTWQTSSSSEAETEEGGAQTKGHIEGDEGKSSAQQKQQESTLVTVDGESELELETLLKASAYILGASGSSIVYKAVMADGSALAVRRIGESSTIDKLKDFDAQVRALAKFRHPNLLRLRGFYWGPDEKLLIHDYAPNGSLANISFNRKLGSSPFHLSWEARLRIARGVARGLAYLHEKKGVHGNVKPSNILLDEEMEPKIADFGMEKLVCGDDSYKLGTSARQFGSKRSTSSLPEHLSPLAGPSPCGSSSGAALLSHPPYHAPESLKSLKPTARWDVYAFGMVLLELISGRVFSEVELCQWNSGFVAEEKNRVVRMADPAIRGELEGKGDALLSCFKLGFACCGTTPQKRPSMKEAVQVLERLQCVNSVSSS